MSGPAAIVVRGNGRMVTGPVIGAAGISASVGKGGVNSRPDVKAVQIAFNNVPISLGGAGDTLAVDGLVGPKTLQAIANFQHRWLTVDDTRCDPRGPTLGLVNAMAGVGDALPPGTASMHSGVAPDFIFDTPAFAAKPAEGKEGAGGQKAAVAAKPAPAPPHHPSPEEEARIKAAETRAFFVEHHHLNIVKNWLINALRVVTSAQAHADRLATLGPMIAPEDPDRLAFLLLAKSFKLHERDPGGAVTGVRRVDSILRQSLVAVTQHLPRIPGVAPSALVTAPLFVCLFGFPKFATDALAYAPQGGLHLKPGATKSFNKFVKPGKVVVELNDRMYLTPSFDSLNPNLQRLTLIHEMAHWVGSPRGANAIPELGTIDAPAKWKPMTSQQRLHTAESYGFFATECNTGTQTAIVDGGSDTTTVPLFPQTEPNFGNTRVIRLPPKGDILEPKFKFPAGALF
jgi:peptidoglycan hydrolase-like protein with peptidoglycan-binding domain